MPSNNSGIRVGYLAARFPNRMAWLIGTGGWREPPEWMPVAIDNGAFPAWTKGLEWDESAFMELLKIAHRFCKPIWAVVPDVVADRDATIESWKKWQPILSILYPRLPLAMAVQDGMTPKDVPDSADWIFVGGGRSLEDAECPYVDSGVPRESPCRESEWRKTTVGVRPSWRHVMRWDWMVSRR